MGSSSSSPSEADNMNHCQKDPEVLRSEDRSYPDRSYPGHQTTQHKFQETRSPDPLDKLRTLTCEDCYRYAYSLRNNIFDDRLKADFNEFLRSLEEHLPQKHLPQATSRPSKPPVPAVKPVKAYLIVTGKTHGADQQFLGLLNAQGSKVTPIEDLQQSDVILLFCPVVSRVGSDVEGAVRKIPGGAQGKPVVLILMHHTRKPDEVLDRTQWSEIYPGSISLDVHVLFHQTRNGLLQCPRNQHAAQTLLSQCERFKKENKSRPHVHTNAAKEFSDINVD